MATEGFQIIAPGIVADADLSTYQYHFVYLSTNHTVGIATSTVAMPLGVLQNKPSAAGDAASVCIFGITKLVAGETLAVTNLIRNSSLGHGMIFDPALGSGDGLSFGVGQVITGGASSQYVTAFINCATPLYYRATA